MRMSKCKECGVKVDYLTSQCDACFKKEADRIKTTIPNYLQEELRKQETIDKKIPKKTGRPNKEKIFWVIFFVFVVLVVVVFSDEKPNRINEPNRIDEEYRTKRDEEQNRRYSYVQEHPNLYSFTKSDILSGQIHLKMSKSDVIASLGEPDNTREYQDINNSISTWIYYLDDYKMKKNTLTFANGSLYSISN